MGVAMPETRRQVFKTSIMSAVGLAVAAGIAACSPSSQGLNALTDGAPSSDDATIVGVEGNTWYVFDYAGQDGNGNPLYTVRSTTTAYGSVYPHQFPFDTSMFTNPVPTAGPGFQTIQNGSFSIGGTQYRVVNGYLTNGSLLRTNTNNRVLSQSHWNEVGKQ
jgi:hypothetical protein